MRSSHYRWVILVSLFFLHVLTAVGQFSIPLLLPYIKDEFGLNYTRVGLFSSSYYLGVAFASTFAGWTADFMGVKRVLVLGTVVTGLFTLIASRISSFWLILLFLLLAGLTYSVITPSTNKATMNWFHERLRATAMGVKQTGINGGGFLAAFIVPPLALSLNWHIALAVVGLLVMVGGAAAAGLYRDPDTRRPLRISFSLCRAQMRTVVSNPNILLLAVEGFFRVGAQTAFLTYLILYLQNALNLPGIITGLFFALAHGSGAAGRVAWGVLSDRIFGGERKKVYIWIALIAGTAFILFGTFTTDTPQYAVIFIVAILGFTAVGYQGVGLSLLVELAGRECTGTASGFGQAFFFFGVVLIVPLFGFIVDLLGTYSYAWVALAIFSFISAGILFFVREDSKHQPM
jgi:MFS transporter, ACS family, hexuronate transporter